MTAASHEAALPVGGHGSLAVGTAVIKVKLDFEVQGEKVEPVPVAAPVRLEGAESTYNSFHQARAQAKKQREAPRCSSPRAPER